MYERFTDRARKVLQLANQEAQRFNHEYIGTEHILLGLIDEGGGTAAQVLDGLGIELRKVRRLVESIIQSGSGGVDVARTPPTPRAKKVIEYAIDEARNLKHNYVSTEHLLLGLLREQEGVAAQVLMNLGLKLEDVREEVRTLGNRRAVGEAPPEDPFDPTTWPAELRRALEELESRIEDLKSAKELAVAACDFEKAARLRDQADKLMKQRQRLIRDAQGI